MGLEHDVKKLFGHHHHHHGTPLAAALPPPPAAHEPSTLPPSHSGSSGVAPLLGATHAPVNAASPLHGTGQTAGRAPTMSSSGKMKAPQLPNTRPAGSSQSHPLPKNKAWLQHANGGGSSQLNTARSMMSADPLATPAHNEANNNVAVMSNFDGEVSTNIKPLDRESFKPDHLEKLSDEQLQRALTWVKGQGWLDSNAEGIVNNVINHLGTTGKNSADVAQWEQNARDILEGVNAVYYSQSMYDQGSKSGFGKQTMGYWMSAYIQAGFPHPASSPDGKSPYRSGVDFLGGICDWVQKQKRGSAVFSLDSSAVDGITPAINFNKIKDEFDTLARSQAGFKQLQSIAAMLFNQKSTTSTGSTTSYQHFPVTASGLYSNLFTNTAGMEATLGKTAGGRPTAKSQWQQYDGSQHRNDWTAEHQFQLALVQAMTAVHKAWVAQSPAASSAAASGSVPPPTSVSNGNSHAADPPVGRDGKPQKSSQSARDAKGGARPNTSLLLMTAGAGAVALWWYLS